MMHKNEMYGMLPTPDNNADIDTNNNNVDDGNNVVFAKTIPTKTMAVYEFTGICTNEEIIRNKDRLESILREHNDETISVLSTAPYIFQYNAPGTIPWRRKNLIGFEVDMIPPTQNETETQEEEDEEVDATTQIETETQEEEDEEVVATTQNETETQEEKDEEAVATTQTETETQEEEDEEAVETAQIGTETQEKENDDDAVVTETWE